MGGEDYGPMVVARRAMQAHELRGATIAVPGLMTSAYLALQLCIGDFTSVVMPFDTIMEAVAAGKVDHGLLIHEGQLTHVTLGLHSVVNLGAWWHEETGLPLPLGVNTIRRSLPDEVKKLASRHLRESIEYGLAHRAAALEWALRYARGMETKTADTFVGHVRQRTHRRPRPGRPRQHRAFLAARARRRSRAGDRADRLHRVGPPAADARSTVEGYSGRSRRRPVIQHVAPRVTGAGARARAAPSAPWAQSAAPLVRCRAPAPQFRIR